jgi:hypothetical protein
VVNKSEVMIVRVFFTKRLNERYGIIVRENIKKKKGKIAMNRFARKEISANSESLGFCQQSPISVEGTL